MAVESRPLPRAVPAAQAAMGRVEMGTGYADRICDFQYSRQHREREARVMRVRVQDQVGPWGCWRCGIFFFGDVWNG